jgi:fructokinase
MNSKLWGIDLGGTKIECVVLDAETNEILIRKRIPTEASEGYQHILNQIKKLIDLIIEEISEKPNAIGFSTPGTLDPSSQKMKNCNTVCMNGQSMKKDLEDLLQIKIAMANDANCFALAEATMGAVPELYPDAKVVFGVIMGTGVGGGVVVNGQVINGKHGIGGEWGHNVLDENGLDCYCGKKGCNETIFAGPALERYYYEISGSKKSMKEIVENYRNNSDEFATQTLKRLFTSFGKAISYIINVLDPDVVVLGGGVSNIDEVYTEGVKELQNFIFNHRKIDTVFLKPKLGDSAGVFGAAELVRY